MLDLFAEVVGLALVLAIVLFLAGAWQHTRCAGFLLLAGSFVLERLIGWGFNAAWTFLGGVEQWVQLFPLAYLLTLALAAAGCLLIYRHFRPAAPAGA